MEMRGCLREVRVPATSGSHRLPIEAPHSPTSCCCEPELARGIELEILGSHLTAIYCAEGKGAKRVPRRIKASDIVCALLDEPDVALCVYCRRHEAIFRAGGGPGRDHSRLGI